MTAVRQQLFALQDPTYQAFQRPLVPTVAPERIIGVRIPALRALARRIAGSPEAEAFLADVPHFYYDENCLHALLISQVRAFAPCLRQTEAFLPFVDNWATCDILRPAAFRTRPPALLDSIRAWIDSPHPYTCRFGLEMLMCHYLGEAFRPEYLDWAAEVRRGEYYVRMMQAWFFATALAVQYDDALPYLLQRRLDPWVHAKTIQKAVESRRLPPERKAYLRTLRSGR